MLARDCRMKRYQFLLILTAALLAACCPTPTPGEDKSAPANPTMTHTAQPLQTATPTPVGTWTMVIEGMVYNTATGSAIAGASIRYQVLHSYFPDIQEGWPKGTLSDEQGQFKLPMMVHDTDHILIVVAATGYMTYEEKLDLFGDRSFNIGLTPE